MMVWPGAQIGGGNYEKLLGQGAKALGWDSISCRSRAGRVPGKGQARNQPSRQPTNFYLHFFLLLQFS